DFEEKDSDMESFIADIQSEYEEELQQVIAGSDVELTTESEDGVRLIRNRETNLGDFCADAYRQIAGADIAFVNGGGIRADLPEGDITYEDILAVHPYGNHLCVVEATGQEILDALEMGSRSTMAETGDGEKAAGESGGFLQVSGLRYTIDTSVDSTVKVDKDGMFVSCGQQRRVKNVEVLQDDGSYEPIDVDETYTLASHDYMLRQSGDGFTMFAGNEMVVEEGMVDYQILITYISDYLGGSIGEQYSSPDGRITVE
ncbi:MAG: 5'-nucleotidase, partial [Anaerovoracaceae bacterium]|nr:5'-nucleotidase [Anaerovoracaceae bacterium]